MEATKECTKCHQTKPVSSFSKLKISKDGFSYFCRTCDHDRKPRPQRDGVIYTGKSGQPAKLIVDGKYRCGRCDELKPVDKFSKSKRTKSGLSNRCKECDAYLNELACEDPEYRQKRVKSSSEWQKKNVKRRWLSKKENTKQLLSDYLRSRLSRAVRNQLDHPRREGWPSAVRDLGCTIPEFMQHIERQFTSGMSWKNYGRGPGKWNIDHIKALATFDLSDPEQTKVACHYTNLAPMWSPDNTSKGALRRPPVRINLLPRRP